MTNFVDIRINLDNLFKKIMTMDKMNYERQLHKQITGKWQIVTVLKIYSQSSTVFFHEGHFVTGLKNNFFNNELDYEIFLINLIVHLENLIKDQEMSQEVASQMRQVS